MLSQETNLKCKHKGVLKRKYISTKVCKSGLAILISDQINLRTRDIARSKKKYHLIMIKGPKHKTFRSVLSVYTCVNCVSQYVDYN